MLVQESVWGIKMHVRAALFPQAKLTLSMDVMDVHSAARCAVHLFEISVNMRTCMQICGKAKIIRNPT